MFREDLLKGKTIIVTGGGTGLGKAMATRVGELGANLVIASRSEKVIQNADEELRKTGAILRREHHPFHPHRRHPGPVRLSQ